VRPSKAQSQFDESLLQKYPPFNAHSITTLYVNLVKCPSIRDLLPLTSL
jgi:hypothetical protein